MTIELQQLVNELEIACRQGHHQHVIQQSTLALNMVDLQLALLDIRARSWCACAKFAKALEDARSMQQLAPTSARGYHRQGRIYAQQGHHSKAIGIYKSTETLTIADDALRDDINIAIKESTQLLEKRIDIINMLPMDIVSLIGSMLLGQDMDEDQNHHACLDVSRSWRKRLSHSEMLCYSIDAGEQYDIITDKTTPSDILSEGHDQIIQLSQYITSLCIQSNKVPFYFLMDRGHFTSLKTLQLQEASFFGEPEKGYATLQKLNNTLRHLELGVAFRYINKDQDYDSTVILERILCVCSNLISLKTNHVFLNIGHLSTYPTLRHFELNPPGSMIDSIDCKKLLLAFPALEYLSIRLIKDTALLTYIDQICPNIQYLEFNHLYIKDTLPKASITSTTLKGLRFLHINARGRLRKVDDIMDIVMRHHSTLEHLAINLQCDMDPSQSRQFMKSQLQFDRLAHVHLGISKPHPFESQSSNEQLIKDACAFFGNVLSRSSNINTLRLSGEALAPAVLRCSLGQLQHLSKIVIGNHYLSSVDEGLSANSEDTLKQVLDEHIDYHSINKSSCTSELKELKFVSHQINKPLLGTITRLRNLEKLSIYVRSRFGSEQIPFIHELYSQCPKLSNLTIKATAITDGFIFELSKRNQLERLTLHVDEKMNDAALLSLIPCNKLKVLRVPRSVSSDVVRVIQNTLPKLEIE